MRAYLAALERVRVPYRACLVAGIGTSTPGGWRERVPGFREAEAAALRAAAEQYVAAADSLAMEGEREYRHHPKTGEPLPHPELCECSHPRAAHPALEGAASWSDRGACSLEGCGCARFLAAPYFITRRDAKLLEKLLAARLPDEFGDRTTVELRALTAKLDLGQLPDGVLAALAEGGGNPLAVLLAAMRGPDGDVVRRAAGLLAPGGELGPLPAEAEPLEP